jgi:sulfhydrogenase subunit delta
LGKPKIAIFKFSSCSGCQLEFLNLENELLDLIGAIDIVYFVEAKRDNAPGPYDICFVEGAITTPEEVERVKEIRKECKLLVATGACATVGGVQALKNWADVEVYKKTVYEKPEEVHTLELSTGIDTYIPVDAYLHGCPIDKEELVEFIVSALLGRKPALRPYSVCMECKLNGNICLLTAYGIPCMGPVTRAGCKALCPTRGRGCYGCHGPMEDANPESMGRILERLGLSNDDIVRHFRMFTGNAEAFRKGAENYE